MLQSESVLKRVLAMTLSVLKRPLLVLPPPAASLWKEAQRKLNRSVSSLNVFLLLTKTIQRYQTQSITSIWLFKEHHKASKLSMAIDFTNAIMVGRRF